MSNSISVDLFADDIPMVGKHFKAHRIDRAAISKEIAALKNHAARRPGQYDYIMAIVHAASCPGDCHATGFGITRECSVAIDQEV